MSSYRRYYPKRTGLFTDIRAIAYIFIMMLAAAVLGLVINFAIKFLPHFHKDFIIFALVAPSVTLVVLAVVVLRSQPRWDVLVLFFLSVLWLAMGSWSADIIAHVECDSLDGQRIETKNGGSMSYPVYCREMKAILALSWTNFVLLGLSFAVILGLIIRLLSFGREDVWEESMGEIPWFNQYNYQQQYGYGYQMGQMGQYPYMAGQPIQTGPNNYVVQPLPGHSVILGQQPAMGMPPTVVQVPA